MTIQTALSASLAGLLIVLASNTVWAQEPSAACMLKRQHIETQIGFAKAAGNSHQVAGLERALAANQAHCSDAQLEQEREEAIGKAELKVAERERELAEAMAKGEPDKIARRQTKLAQARQQLIEAQQPVPR